MQKNYEADTQKAIEQVIRVFQDYIKASPHFDLLWSDKDHSKSKCGDALI